MLAGALVLSGCSVTPGAAAVVEGRTVSHAELQDAQQDMSIIIDGVTAPVILMALVVAPKFIEAAAEQGVGVSTAEARELIATNAAAAGIEQVPTFGAGAVEIVRFTLALQNLRGLPDAMEVLQEIDAEVRALDVDINPRYGELDPESGSIVATALPWIVVPAQ